MQLQQVFRRRCLRRASCLNKGKVSLISGDGVNQLQILIFILALYHVFSCVLTFSFGHLK
ncbi:hypothetical protein MKX01_038579, partial [Papaver californicum]